MPNKAFKSDSQRLAVSLRSSIAKRRSHLNAALSVSGGMVLKFIFGVLFILFSSFVWCQEQELATSIKEVQEPSVQTANIDKNEVNSSTGNIKNGINIIKDITHILFFISMATIGVLSYRQAKKTVFSPIKTEIFKYQLQAFEEVISHFQNKSEMDLLDDMDMKSIVDINCFELFCGYVGTFFDDQMKIDEKYIEEKRKLRKGAIVSAEFAAEHFQVIGPETKAEPKPNNKEIINDPALKLAQWNDRKYGMIHFTENYRVAVDEIERFQSSPLLPDGLKVLLKDYSLLMHESLSAVGDAIEEASKQMPVNFPNPDTLKGFGDSWLSNIYNKKRPDLEPKAKEILEFINKYLGIDSLANENA
ncbi:hypothetical protein V6238_10880 [Marinomonas arenicola]|uniref:hypothetical protein n=1 Tax=Marinomonas arenicola TaxID=569601 RepID=UPI00311F416D